MIERSIIEQQVRALVAEMGEIEISQLSEDTPLIGPGSAIPSRVIVELLLSLEEYAEDNLNCEFDWMSDSAMSLENSQYRNIGVLADHLYGLQKDG